MDTKKVQNYIQYKPPGKLVKLNSCAVNTQLEENFHINYAILFMANLLNLNSAHYYIFRNLSMIAHTIEIHKLIFANN